MDSVTHPPPPAFEKPFITLSHQLARSPGISTYVTLGGARRACFHIEAARAQSAGCDVVAIVTLRRRLFIPGHRNKNRCVVVGINLMEISEKATKKPQTSLRSFYAPLTWCFTWVVTGTVHGKSVMETLQFTSNEGQALCLDEGGNGGS